MRYGYFGVNGKLITTSSPNRDASMPTGAMYSMQIPDDADVNGIYLHVPTRTVVPRMQFDVVTTRNKIEGIPSGTLTIYNMTDCVVSDGALEFEADVEAVIPVYLMHDHYVSCLVEVETGP